MLTYILKRLLLIIPTLWGIITINFIVIQFLPGGPVEQTIAQLTMPSISATARLETQSDISSSSSDQSDQSLSHGVSDATLERIKKMYGFDKPAWERYFDLIKAYVSFDLGKSYYRDSTVLDIIYEKLPVSISLGFWSTILLYSISIPLGIKKAIRQGSKFDKITTNLILLGNATPTFLFAVLMIIFFASGEYWKLFPLRGLTSDNFEMLNWYEQIIDYLWHLILPIISITISGFATLTLLTKNSFLDEIHKTYVLTARLKGLNENKVLYHHVLRNALLLIISSIPGAIIEMFFTGSLLIEIIFSLDGLGLLSYEATIQRDYPIVFGTLYLFSLMGLVVNILSDITYSIVDKRIDFQRR
ncbi:MAG: microcin C ABC transporter permease YejB [Pseudomonadota bacterium]|nr:microcin C ABC transporter permease YejB [Pseudomonadota bacterium]